MPAPIQTPPPQTRISPWISMLILLGVALVAWALIARNAKSPVLRNEAPTAPSLGTAGQGNVDTKGKPALLGTVTYIQGLSLTTLATIEDNPGFSANRVLIVALHAESKITDKNGTVLTPEAIKVNDRIAVWSSMKLTDKEPVLAADRVVVNP